MASVALEDYLKAIYKVAESQPDGTAGTSAIADRLRVTRASVAAMLRKLDERGLVTHRPYRGVRLTRQGQRIAVEMIRRHRVIEAFLVQMLDMPLEEVDAQAEVLEHAFSADLVDRLWHRLGCPAHDPHGAPIPAPNELPSDERTLLPLPDLPTGRVAMVARLAAENVDQLRYLARHGLKPGVLLHREEDGRPDRITLRIDGAGRLHLDRSMAQAVRVQDPGGE
ncbi:MAG: metal-dependent transcriptional regulator [Halothiobacillaceae bacterium]